jgi:metal-dependent amidase/aminoacylase/carboxypeptidase family protein
MVHTGVHANIIPGLAKLDGTIRIFDDEVKKTIARRVREIVESVARGSGGSAEVEFDRHVPVLMSEPALVKRMLPAVECALGAANASPSPPAMAADDFAYFAQVAPVFFFALGTQKPGMTSGINHATNFVADD